MKYQKEEDEEILEFELYNIDKSTENIYDLDNVYHRKLFSGERGIYAIIYENNIVYVGQSVNLEQRLSQHKDSINRFWRAYDGGEIKTMGLYFLISTKLEHIKFRILQYGENFDLDIAELTYIKTLRPKFNSAGIDKPYIGTNR